MATAVKAKPVIAAQRFVFHDVGWEGYQTLLRMAGDRPIRVTYDRGDDYIANAARIYKRDRINLGVDPPPDLAIEIDVTNSSINRMGVYAAIGIPEVWRFDGAALSVSRLQEDGSYTPTETSAAFPFLPMAAIARFLLEYDLTDDTPWALAFRAWVRAEIVPRIQGAAGNG